MISDYYGVIYWIEKSEILFNCTTQYHSSGLSAVVHHMDTINVLIIVL